MATTGSLKQLSHTGSPTSNKLSGNNLSGRGGLPSRGGTSPLGDAPSIHRFPGMIELLEPPHTLDDLDVKQNMVTDILLRLTYNEGEVSVTRAEEILK